MNSPIQAVDAITVILLVVALPLYWAYRDALKRGA